MRTPEKAGNGKAKIVIVDDHPIVRRGIFLLVEQEKDMQIVGEADDAAEAMFLIEKVKPDLVLIDISLRGISGIELTRNILGKYPKMLVLVISMHDESVYLERSLRAGAKGYIMKQETPDYIIAAIRKVLKGEIYVSEKMKESVMDRFVHGKKAADGVSVGSLSDREAEVLGLIGQGYTTNRIASELYVSVKTIESHYANIKSKLGLNNSHELIQYAVKWCFSEIDRGNP